MIAFMRELVSQPRAGKTVRNSRGANHLTPLQKQVAGYAGVLRDLGATLEFVPPLTDRPAGFFVEDAAVLLPEVSIVARPGAAFRAEEMDSVVQTLAQHRPLQSICEPGALNGGDVLRIGQTLYVTTSSRTNEDGIEQLREIVGPFGYDIRIATTHESRPLKTACTFIPPHFVVVNPARIDARVFGNQAIFAIDEKEPTGANTLTLGRTTLISAACPKTEKRLREAGVTTRRIDIPEVEKADGCLTSLSLILESRSTATAVPTAELRTIHTTDAPPPAGHSSQAIVHGGLAYVSPQPPFDATADHSSALSAGDQTEQALQNLAAVLAASGSSLARVVRTTLHVADPHEIPQVEATYQRVFGKHRPACSVVANSALPAGVRIQIEAVAAVAGLMQ